MLLLTATAPKPKAPQFRFRELVAPTSRARRATCGRFRVAAIIPTYAPGPVTERLVYDLLKYNPGLVVYLVDDCTPTDMSESMALCKRLESRSSRVHVLRTAENKLKAGALNTALERIARVKGQPNVVLTLDDDVVIAPETVRNLVEALMSSDSLGAACSECRVLNKNKNILTRLQGLEYLGFNAIRLADEGLYRGPLVMHGMLTAFRMQALREARGFSEGHLIEDYEVTTRLKSLGWSVRSVHNAPAWTVVPETLSRLWRQRTRWSYGGIMVVSGSRSVLPVFQDMLGHVFFLGTLIMVALLYASRGSGGVGEQVAQFVIIVSLAQLALSYAFQLWLMRSYREKDAADWFLRLTLLPELLYGYMMTFALIGSYLFHSFSMFRRLLEHRIRSFEKFWHLGAAFFRFLGYTERHWGTRGQHMPI